MWTHQLVKWSRYIKGHHCPIAIIVPGEGTQLFHLKPIEQNRGVSIFKFRSMLSVPIVIQYHIIVKPCIDATNFLYNIHYEYEYLVREDEILCGFCECKVWSHF